MIKFLLMMSVLAFGIAGIVVIDENKAMAAGPCNSAAQNCP
jgi:hypothetical protein